MLWFKQLYLLVRVVTDIDALYRAVFTRTAILNPHPTQEGCYKVLFVTGGSKYTVATAEADYKEITGTFPNIQFCLKDKQFHWQQQNDADESTCVPVTIAEIEGKW